jgi:diguanylate cyclase (GGDEF)-like protein/hemerythrin-like metal-binding protein
MIFKVRDFPIFHRYLAAILLEVGLADGLYSHNLKLIGEYTVADYCRCDDPLCSTVNLNSMSLVGKDGAFANAFNKGWVIINFYPDGKMEIENLADNEDCNFPFQMEIVNVFARKALEYLMESFVWGQHFITGLEQVDSQHRRLITVLNRFGTVLTENKVLNQDVESTLTELVSYTEYHFQAEERLMSEQLVDPRHVEVHVADHRNFFDDVTALIQNIKPDQLETNHALLEFLTQWVSYHILGADQNMARQISSISEGMSPADAYAAEEKKTKDSTGALLTALNNLYRQVTKRNKELLELNQHLEEKVADRTKALQDANQHLETLALTDTLTKLSNRRFAMRRLQQLWKGTRQNDNHLCCMMIDADGFKGVNDTYGHDSGDEILRQLARELRNSVRNDDIVCRLGGDEFLVICPGTSLEGALHLAEEVRANVADLHVQRGKKGIWHGSVSVGVACRSQDQENIDQLLKAADDAVYLAKSAGRNCVKTAINSPPAANIEQNPVWKGE